jgi:hypothetical protein
VYDVTISLVTMEGPPKFTLVHKRCSISPLAEYAVINIPQGAFDVIEGPLGDAPW